MFELNVMSPASVPPLIGGGGEAKAGAPAPRGVIEIRMSPKRGSPCWLPDVASGAPLSETSARLMFVTDSQRAAARSIADCQAAVVWVALRVENRLLEIPPTLVPSGMKLYVIRLPYV